MSPSVGPFPAYPLFLGAASLAGSLLTLRLARRCGIPRRSVVLILGVLAITALSGAKLYSLLERGARLPEVSAELWNGYRYPGGMLGFLTGAMLLGCFRPGGLSVGTIADLLAPAFALGMAVERVGCFLRGCCFGTVCSLPWCVGFPARSPAWNAHVAGGLVTTAAPASLPVHPLQLYFGLWAAIVLALVLWVRGRTRYPGQLFLLFVLVHDSGKFLLEGLRHHALPHVQMMSAALAVAAGTALLVQSSFRRAEPGHFRGRRRTMRGGASGTTRAGK